MQKDAAVPLILAVDDEPMVLTMMERFLTDAGFEVIKASDGMAAISQVRDHNPDLVLLDITMPGLDGILTLVKIREISDVPVIIVTASNDEQNIKESFDKGADDFIGKPFRSRDLIARIEAKLRR